MNKIIVYIKIMAYYSAIKCNKVLINAMNVEHIMLNERSQWQKPHYMIPFMLNIPNIEIYVYRK